MRNTFENFFTKVGVCRTFENYEPSLKRQNSRLPMRLGCGAWIGGGPEPPGTCGSALRCELREFALPVPFAVPLNSEDFCLTPVGVFPSPIPLRRRR